jgi:hypothetical protein
MTLSRHVSGGSGRFDGPPHPEDQGTTILRNVGNETRNDTASHPGTPEHDAAGEAHQSTDRKTIISECTAASGMSYDEYEALAEVAFRPPQSPHGLT